MAEWVKIELGYREVGHLVYEEREGRLGLLKARQVLWVAGLRGGR